MLISRQTFIRFGDEYKRAAFFVRDLDRIERHAIVQGSEYVAFLVFRNAPSYATQARIGSQ